MNLRIILIWMFASRKNWYQNYGLVAVGNLLWQDASRTKILGYQKYTLFPIFDIKSDNHYFEFKIGQIPSNATILISACFDSYFKRKLMLL